MKKFCGTCTLLVMLVAVGCSEVDDAARQRLIDFQIEKGIRGLIPLGSTSQF